MTTDHWFARILPPVVWLREYKRAWIGFDLLAGVTLAAFAIPVGLAQAELAGLPPQTGVYCFLFGCAAYALFGTSRQLAVGPTTAICVLLGSTLPALASHDPQRTADLAALTALTVAAMSVVAWIFRLSSLVNFISETILLGFKAGAAVSIAMTQLPKLFGVPDTGGGTLNRAIGLVRQLPYINGRVLVFGLIALAILLVGERFLPGRPVALLVVAVSILVIALTPLGELGFALIGDLPRGLPALRVPPIRFEDVNAIAPLAFACLVLGYIEASSAAKLMADKNDYLIDAHQELLALGAVNVAAGLAHGFPCAGGLSQSSVNDKAGARSPLALVAAVVVMGTCVVFFSGLLRDLPTVVLAAIIIAAVVKLVDVRRLRTMWKISRFEFGVAMIAFVGVLAFGILQGVVLASLISVVLIIGRVAHPHVAFLGRIPGTNRYSDLHRNPSNERIPGAVLFRVESDIVYFNCTHIHDEVLKRVRSYDGELTLVVCDLSTSPTVDVAGTRLMAHFDAEFAALGAEFRIVEPHSRVRDILRAAGLEELVGHVSRRISMHDVVTKFEQETQSRSR